MQLHFCKLRGGLFWDQQTGINNIFHRLHLHSRWAVRNLGKNWKNSDHEFYGKSWIV